MASNFNKQGNVRQNTTKSSDQTSEENFFGTMSTAFKDIGSKFSDVLDDTGIMKTSQKSSSISNGVVSSRAADDQAYRAAKEKIQDLTDRIAETEDEDEKDKLRMERAKLIQENLTEDQKNGIRQFNAGIDEIGEFGINKMNEGFDDAGVNLHLTTKEIEERNKYRSRAAHDIEIAEQRNAIEQGKNPHASPMTPSSNNRDGYTDSNEHVFNKSNVISEGEYYKKDSNTRPDARFNAADRDKERNPYYYGGSVSSDSIPRENITDNNKQLTRETLEESVSDLTGVINHLDSLYQEYGETWHSLNYDGVKFDPWKMNKIITDLKEMRDTIRSGSWSGKLYEE